MTAENAITPSTNGDNGLPEVRDAKGRFVPGNPGGPGNPQARNVAAWRGALASAVSAEDIAEVTGKLIEEAKAGEPWAVRELLDRCLGKPHVQIDLQADPERMREYTRREHEEARRITRIMLSEDAD